MRSLRRASRCQPWTRSINEKLPDGYIALIDERGIRIAADGFVGTNEIRMDANEEWLYVVETNAKRISRLRVAPDGALTNREVFGPSGLNGCPDGCAFDIFAPATMGASAAAPFPIFGHRWRGYR